MSNAIFASMKRQMIPSPAAQASLWEQLVGELIQSKKERQVMKRWKPLALAACAALVLCGFPAYNALKPQEVKLHSYTLVEGGGLDAIKSYKETAALGGDTGVGDQDQPMLPEEVVEAMEEAGFSTADIDAYQALGYQMTWAKWWKYVGSAETPDLESLRQFSAQELPVNTGDLDEPVADVPAQPGADAYQLLMDHFGGEYPDWYGGAYINDQGTLTVLLVEELDPGDKSLELEVLEAVGENAPVAFAGAKYSRNDLERMNADLLKVLDGDGIFTSFGIYEDQNRIILDVWEPLPDDILAAIARIDPADDAILIRVVEDRPTVTEDLMKGPPPVDTIGDTGDSFDVVRHLPGGVTAPYEGTVDEEEGEEPAVFTADPNAPVPDDEDLLAIEPQIENLPAELPQAKLPGTAKAEYDLLPRE